MDSLNRNVFKSYTHADLDAYYGNDLNKAVQKADAPMLTGTAGMFNAIHGRKAFSQLNELAMTYGVLPKVSWNTSGWRVRTVRGVTLGSGGVADGATIGDAVKSTIIEVFTTPKMSETVFAQGTVFKLLNGDDKYAFEAEAELKSDDHLKDINKQLLTDWNTPAAANFESIDRVCSSNSEANDATIGGTPANANMYNSVYDRASATTFDAYVDHNSGTDRAVSIDIIRDAIRQVYSNSGKKITVLITGSDQYTNIVNLFESNNRYGYMSNVSGNINGIKTETGQDVGLRVAMFDGIPIIEDNDVKTDTGSRIYGINTDTTFLAMARPTKLTTVDEEGILRAHQDKAMFTTIGELICVQPSANFKIRDLN
jgi:hypothetical protein